MTLDAYHSARSAAGKLKLKAQARLAFGETEETFEACVLLHEAARGELRAERLIDAPPETSLGALAEACYCHILGRDPLGAVQVWADILEHPLHGSDSATANAILRDLEVRVERARSEYARSLSTLSSFRNGTILPATASGRKRAIREAEGIVAAFPGVAGWWWALYRLAAADERWDDAWEALGRARRLEPENVRFEAMLLLTAFEALPRREAHRHLEAARPRLTAERPELCLMFALGQLRLAKTSRGTKRSPHWERARNAVRLGLSGGPTGSVFRNLRATELLVQDLLDGKTPSLDALYRAGLADLAVTAPPGADVAKLLSDSIHLAA